VIIDAQTHVVSDDPVKFPKRDDAYTWPATTGAAVIAAMDAAGIDRSFLQQAYGVYGNDNSYLLEVVKAHPDRFAGAVCVDQIAPSGPDTLSDLIENHGMSALRLVWNQQPNVLADPASYPLWQRAADLGIPVVVAAQLVDIPSLVTPLERFPGVRVSLEHYWGNALGDPPYERIAPVLELARFPNLYVRVVSNNSYAAREGTGSPHAFFSLLAERFGPQRLVWGSNYPGHWDKHGGVGERLALAREDLAFLGTASTRAIFGETALGFWPGAGSKKAAEVL
jgi:predicted TIM-barrel fold metal-dependent hydrolase